MTRLEPLKFQPSLRERIWGARNLAPVLGNVDRPVGEVWCAHEESRVAHGPLAGRTLASLLAEFGGRLMGHAWKPVDPVSRRTGWAQRVGRRATFPILGKLLFAAGELSIQVHPDDKQAGQLEGGRGKTELWYVVAAEPGARLGLGLREDIDAARLATAAAEGGIERLVRWVPAQAGQCVLVPAGTVHAAGGGVVLCEIQQNSDLTYRLHDYGRLDFDGKPRLLRIARALQAAKPDSRPDVGAPRPVSDGACRIERLGRCAHFSVELLSWNQPFLYIPDSRRCQILICVRGRGSLNAVPFREGDAFLIPAEAARFPVDGLEAQGVLAYPV